MKVFLIACLAVAAMAESDPNLILTNGMVHSGLYPYNTMINQAVVSPISYIQPTTQILKSGEEKVVKNKVEVEMKKPIVYTTQLNTPFYNTINPVVTSYMNPVQKIAIGPQIVQENGEVKSVLHKREAEADPWMVYNNAFYGVPAFRSVASPVVATNEATFYNPFTMDVTGKYKNDAVTANMYANKGQYVARAPGTNTVHVAKREADPLTVISSPFYSGLVNQPIVNQPLVGTPVVSSPFYSGLYNPVLYNQAVVTKSMASPIENTPLGGEGVVDGKTVADDAAQWTPNYAGKGMFKAETPGTVHRARREADPLLVRTAGVYGYPTRTIYSRPAVYSSIYRPSVVRSGFWGYY